MGESRLARLEAEEQHLIEHILLASCNLKEVAQVLQVSYPTLRKRLTSLVDKVRLLQEQDNCETQRLLDEVEKGKRNPEEAARLIGEMAGG